MRMGERIALYRKNRNLTQEQLGDLIGVSNQAVSKWENGQTLPDVMLLPKVADALGVTLSQLYGLNTDHHELNRVFADDYPARAYDLLFDSFYHAAGCRFAPVAGMTEKDQILYQKGELENGKRLGCVSNKAGAVVLTDGFAFVDGDYKRECNLFESLQGQIILRMLSDVRVRIVLAYGYAEGFKRDKRYRPEFTLSDLAAGCSLSMEDTADALQSLASLKVIDQYRNEIGEMAYSFSVMKLLYAFEIFRLSQMLLEDDVWLVVRDTSTISDYAFEKSGKKRLASSDMH